MCIHLVYIDYRMTFSYFMSFSLHKINTNKQTSYVLLCSVFLSFVALNRQKSLEDSLLVAGQFKDALQLLLDWLYKVEPSLNEDQPVHGDIDTVHSLIEQHKVSCLSFIV